LRFRERIQKENGILSRCPFVASFPHFWRNRNGVPRGMSGEQMKSLERRMKKEAGVGMENRPPRRRLR
jgi:hypothetical protein